MKRGKLKKRKWYIRFILPFLEDRYSYYDHTENGIRIVTLVHYKIFKGTWYYCSDYGLFKNSEAAFRAIRKFEYMKQRPKAIFIGN